MEGMRSRGKAEEFFLFQSLFLKISLSVGLIVTITLAVFAFFLIQNQKEHLSLVRFSADSLI